MSHAENGLLLDRAAISDVVYAYATGLDRRDWALFRSIFTDSIEMEFSSAGIRSGTYSADDWVRSAKRLFAGFSATQHTSTNHVHDIRSDEATCVSNMQAEHFVARDEDEGPDEGQDRWTLGGFYVNELVRQAEGWKLAKVTLNVTWQFGNPEVPRIAARRGRAVDSSA
jgi:hypothetical protein